jgi:ethanolamine utilization protein EutA
MLLSLPHAAYPIACAARIIRRIQMSESENGGRVFFARARRAPDIDSEIRLISVGVDIGSATSHLAFSRLVLVRRGNGAQLIRRELLHESGVILTPFRDVETIDAERLGAFIAGEYTLAGIDPPSIDTGALILTGLAAARQNARAIGEIFAAQAGRFVAVAAGDALETTLSAHGSGAVAASAQEGVVINLDIGGGTSKVARCVAGRLESLTALNIGARLVLFDAQRRVAHLEPQAVALLTEAGLAWLVGDTPPPVDIAKLATTMVRSLIEVCGGSALSALTSGLLRLPPLPYAAPPAVITVSGGVAEYLRHDDTPDFGDLGHALADALRNTLGAFTPWRVADQALRATVIGASQFSVQLSGNTIFVDPPEALPMASVPVICPLIDYDRLDPAQITDAVLAARRRLSVEGVAVAVAYDFQGDATHHRLSAFCAGMSEALPGQALVLVGRGDVGGLIGAELRWAGRAGPIVSIDGISLAELDFIDIGALLQVSGGVPVVVKSLVF